MPDAREPPQGAAVTGILPFPAPRPGPGRHWGKAGVPLTADEIEAARRARAVAANKERIAHERAMQKARSDWAAGRVVPWLITIALDADGLDGPEVDEACGVPEPGVDMWEAGTLYPSFEQLCALAKLTGKSPGYFMNRPGVVGIKPSDTTLRFHMSMDGEMEPVMAFTPEAIAAAVAGDGACPTCRRPR
jgi:transcriptional regulator with XRE-family HTH domain